MKKKIIAYVVSAVMVLTMVPATAFAATDADGSGMSKTAPDALTKAQEAAIADMEDAFAARNDDSDKYYASAQVAEWEALIAEYTDDIDAATTTEQVDKYETEYGIKLDAIIDAATIIKDYAKSKIAAYNVTSDSVYAATINDIVLEYVGENGKLVGELTDAEVDALVSEAQAKMDAVTVPVDVDKIDAAVTKYSAMLDSWVDDNYYEGATFNDNVLSVVGVDLDGDPGNEIIGTSGVDPTPVVEAIKMIIDDAKDKMQEESVGQNATVDAIKEIWSDATTNLENVTGTQNGVGDGSAKTAEFEKFSADFRNAYRLYKTGGSKAPESYKTEYSGIYPSADNSYRARIGTDIQGKIDNLESGYFEELYKGRESLKAYVEWKKDPSTSEISYDAAGIKEVTDRIDTDIANVPKGAVDSYDFLNQLRSWIGAAERAGYADSTELQELQEQYDAITCGVTVEFEAQDEDDRAYEYKDLFNQILVLGDKDEEGGIFGKAVANNDALLSESIKTEMSLVGDDSDAVVNSTVTNTNYNDIAAEVKRIEAMFEDYVGKVDDATEAAFKSWNGKYMSGDETIRGVEYYKTTLTQKFIKAVNELGEPKGFDPANTDAWEAAEKAYANLSDEMKKEEVEVDGITMAEALEKYADYEAVAAPIMNAIVNVKKLMDQATDEASVKAAWDAYKALPKNSQQAVDPVTLGGYTLVKKEVLAAKAEDVIKEAINITNYKQVTKEFVDAYEAVVAEYEYYDERISGLSLATSDINNYNTNIERDFKKAIDDIKNAPDKAVASDAAAIKAARAIYDGMLTDEAKKVAKDSGYLAWLEKYEAAVSQYDLSTGSMTLSATEITLGDAAPTVAVKDATGKELVADTDYTVAYTGLDQVGEATVTVTGAGSYTGTLEAKITVKAIDLSKGSMTLSATEITLGDPNPTVVVKDAAGKELVADTDYTVAYTGFDQVGEATVTVTGTGNYTGTLEAKVAVKAADIDISNGKVIMDGPSIEGGYSYIERGETPDIAVHVDGQPIPETAYTVDFNDKAYAGLTSLTVRANDGSGYDGELTYSYVVVNGAKNIKSLKAGTKSFTVKYSDYSKYGCTGTQIAWKTSKNGEWKYSKITSNDASKKVTVKAAGKKYVKVRAIVKVDGVRYYGDWSKTKTVTVR